MNETLDDLKYLPFTCLVRDDETNVRTRYDEAALQEMKDSIHRDGVLQNLGVAEREDGMFTVVWGFRRHKGVEALMAELLEDGSDEAIALAQIRAMVPVKVLDAAGVKSAKRLQVIENLQKEGVDPVDEARGYQKLLSMTEDDGTPVYATYEALALALGKRQKGESYIRKRIKLLEAPDFLLDAIRDGVVVSVRIGELIGAMPGKKERETMARYAIKHPQLGIPMSTCQVKEMIELDFTKSLLPATFDLLSTTLLDGAQKATLGFMGAEGEDNDGSCQRCLHRTGNDPLLRDELQAGGASAGGAGSTRGIGAQVCQAPHCLRLKQESAWRVIESQAEASGLRVMDRAKAKGLWQGEVFEGPLAAQYVRKDYRPDYDCTGHMAEESMPTWGEILDGEHASWLLVQTPKKKGFVYLLERTDAIELAEAMWKRKGEKNLFANRPGAAVKSEAGKAKSESPELPLGDGILRFEDPEEKDQTDQTDQTDRTDQTDAPAKGTGPSKEAIKAKFNELLFEELAAHVLPAKDLWLAYLSDVLRQVSVAALKLAVIGLGIELNVDHSSPEQLREMLRAYYRSTGALDMPANCLLLVLAYAITDHDPSLKPLLAEGIAEAEVDTKVLLEKAKKALAPAKVVKPKKTAAKVVTDIFPGEEDEMVFLDRLMNEPVPVSGPNDCGVFCEPTAFRVKLGGVQGLSIYIARDAQDLHYAFEGYNLGDKCSGSRLPRAADKFESRAEAVKHCLYELRYDRNIGDHAKALGVMDRVFNKWLELTAVPVNPAKEELFTCDVCGRENFTKSGLRSHNCAKGVAKKVAAEQGLEPRLKMWLNARLSGEVIPVSAPNEYGVFVGASSKSPLDISPGRTSKSKDFIAIDLATDAQGKWYSSTQRSYRAGKAGGGSGGGLPNVKWPCLSREAAVRDALISLRDHLSPQATHGHAMIKAMLAELAKGEKSEASEPAEVVFDARAEYDAANGSYEAYHCDACGVVCRVPAKLSATVATMKNGEFLCEPCALKTPTAGGWDVLPFQQDWLTWKPKNCAA